MTKFKASKMNEIQVSELSGIIRDISLHEKKTVVLLGEALPLVLNHIWGNSSVNLANSLLKALSPANRKAAVFFFSQFQPHKYGADKNDKRSKSLGKRISKEHTLNTRQAMSNFFSLNDKGEVDPKNGYFNGDYWLFIETNVNIEDKEVNYLGNIDKAIKSAKEKGSITFSEILKHTVATEGLTVEDVLTILEHVISE